MFMSLLGFQCCGRSWWHYSSYSKSQRGGVLRRA